MQGVCGVGGEETPHCHRNRESVRRTGLVAKSLSPLLWEQKSREEQGPREGRIRDG